MGTGLTAKCAERWPRSRLPDAKGRECPRRGWRTTTRIKRLHERRFMTVSGRKKAPNATGAGRCRFAVASRRWLCFMRRSL